MRSCLRLPHLATPTLQTKNWSGLHEVLRREDQGITERRLVYD
jgi:hypothetical protein